MAEAQAVAQHCMVCGEILLYQDRGASLSCHYCGRQGTALIICPAGHFVCDSCHGAATLELLPRLAERVQKSAPEDILEELLLLPGLPMHGPEHHALPALALLLAARKLGRALPENAVAEAIRRSMVVPGGACGYLGACGAGISLGVAVSLLTGATPVRGNERGMANRASAAGLCAAGDGGARCCKRALRKVVRQGRIFVEKKLGIRFEPAEAAIPCRDMPRNRECLDSGCPFHDPIDHATTIAKE